MSQVRQFRDWHRHQIKLYTDHELAIYKDAEVLHQILLGDISMILDGIDSPEESWCTRSRTFSFTFERADNGEGHGHAELSRNFEC